MFKYNLTFRLYIIDFNIKSLKKYYFKIFIYYNNINDYSTNPLFTR